MSLNCLTCQTLLRTDSDREWGNEKPFRSMCCSNAERSWSGNLGPLPCQHAGSGSLAGSSENVKKGHRRLGSTGSVAFGEGRQPRLVRSSGMRRDWSFEKLHKTGGE